MSEPAALTHARDEVMIAAWFQCTSLYIDGDPSADSYRIVKRCSGNRMEAHHATKRSQGGGHEASNLAAWCSDCHARLESIGRRTGPFTDGDDRRFWFDDIGGRNEIRKLRVYEWRDFKDDLETRFIENEATLALGATYGIKGQHALGFGFEENERLSLWQMDPDLLPEDTSFGAYLRNRGLKIADSTLIEKLNVYRVLKERGVTLMDTLEAVDVCAQVHKFPPGYGAIRDSLPAIRKMDREQIVNLLSTTPSSDVKATITDRSEALENKAAAERGEVRVTMSATLEVEIQHTMTSLGSEGQDRAKLEGRLRQAIGKRGIPGSYRFKHHLREILRTE